MNHQTPEIRPSTATANKTKPKQGKDKDCSCKEPHLWSFEQKKKLLELLLDYSRRGRATNNANLKKDAWALAATNMNDAFDIGLDVQQLQNQKAALRKSYQDFKFLRNQSGFGWDKELSTPTVDPKAWDKLIVAHPRCSLGQLPPTRRQAPVLQDHKRNSPCHLCSSLANLKHKLALEANDDDDIGEGIQLSSSHPAYKHCREGKNTVLSTGIQGLILAINKALEGSKDLVGAMVFIASQTSLPSQMITTLFQAHHSIHTPHVPQSPSKCALEKLQDIFGNNISDDNYVDYVCIVEDNMKAHTFLKLAQTTSLE
ncbi:uncharacterized protein PGTG_06214 [Puccinia graminis f. sp. tritici CRL 75-36-700-3]|uniref:Myb/SANT-like domain-containing protein n=1 Tax=Puccinia graminis f. sp. tritici (strain CRL 75-36-700-3 / race SCCL) TaxID=418459 RepID=E3K7A9_PUCGT|nr:uncharacterized protein PGTG_06214 [Puccinia graminis f. sp. tritici CRL 75-36-700-3]EFP80258.1 hypothetical protein PGTG_06214 [Puccinia graminis f. sp. tritici CRL 75-36-700-3]